MLSGGTIVSFSLRLNILIQAEEVRRVGTLFFRAANRS